MEDPMPGTGAHNHEASILPASGKNCPVREGFRFLLAGLIQSLFAFSNVNYAFSLKLPLRQPLETLQFLLTQDMMKSSSRVNSTRKR